MTDADIEEAKAALRARGYAQRRQLARTLGADAGQQAAEHFLDGVTLAPDQVVAAYWPIRDEIDCRPLLARLMDNGQRVCLPAVVHDAGPLELRLWAQDAALYPAGFGTLAPDDSSPVVEPDLIIVPLLGFDSWGTRLGYGKGHYDRTLAAMRKRPRLVGFAYAGQQFDRIPRAAHDVPLDAVVTEQGVVAFRSMAAAS